MFEISKTPNPPLQLTFKRLRFFQSARCLIVVLLGFIMRLANIYISLAFIAALLSPAALAVDDPVRSFEQHLALAKESTNSNTSVHFNKRKNGWMKQRYRVIDLKFDVKKTDSLVSPIVGLVSMDLLTEASDAFPSQEEAEKLVSFDPKASITDRMSLSYVYRDAKWTFSKGSYEVLSPPLKGTRFDLTEDRLSRLPLPYWVFK